MDMKKIYRKRFNERESRNYLQNGELIIGQTTLSKESGGSRRIGFVLSNSWLQWALPVSAAKKMLKRSYHKRQMRRVYEQLMHATSQYIHPNVYGYKSGKIHKDAVKYIHSGFAEGYVYILRTDLQDFFDTVSLEQLENCLAKILPDRPELVNLLMRISRLPRYDMLFGDIRAANQCIGIVPGLSFSNLCANLYLRELDEFLGEESPYCVRNGDDIALSFKTEREARHALRALKRFLEQRYPTLRLHPDKTRIGHASQTELLGYRFLSGELDITLSTLARLKVYERVESTLWMWRKTQNIKICNRAFCKQIAPLMEQLSIVTDQQLVQTLWTHLIEGAVAAFHFCYPTTILKRQALKHIGIGMGQSQRLLTGRMTVSHYAPFEAVSLKDMLLQALTSGRRVEEA